MSRITRRRFVGASAAAIGVATLPRRARAAEFTYKYANNTPVDHPMNVNLLTAHHRMVPHPILYAKVCVK